MKTEVSFHSTAFNCIQPRDYFINECCFGDDLVRWLIQELRNRGIKTADEPRQEDFGWYFTFDIAGTRHCFVITFQPNNPAQGDRWLGWLERQTGLVGSLLGGRKWGIKREAIVAIDAALRNHPEIHNLNWHEAGSDD